MWANESVFYFCGAPFENDGVQEHRITKVSEWVEHMSKLGINAIYFSPVFESDTHGYNTRDFRKIDCRLGTNEDFAKVCKDLHDAGIKVVLDGVFNHVGRGFWAFQDVLKNREGSPYKDWFYINFGGSSNYNDGLWYEGWEGHFDLVKLNLNNPQVVDHILECVSGWVNEFDIDGLRLDVAYCLDRNFMRRLRSHCDGLKKDFFLVGEIIHGDYKQIVNPEMLQSCTNYECYKGMYSSFNSMNMFEICHSVKNMFGPEDWCRCKGMDLLNFVDNHDVTRAASILTNPEHLPLLYGLLFAIKGMPCIYYGSEWGTKAEKKDGDPALRACFEKPEWNELTDLIAKLCEIRKNSKALAYGDISVPVLTNRQCIIQRKFEDERILIAINADSAPYTAHFDAGCGQADELITGTVHDFGGGSELKPYSVEYWKMEK